MKIGRFNVPTIGLGAGLVVTLSLGTLGLRSCGGDNSQSADFPTYASGVEFEKRTGEDFEKGLERQIFYGEDFYIEKTEQINGQLGLRFIPFDGSRRVRDLDSGEETLEHNNACVYTRVESERDTEDGLANEVTLSTQYSPETMIGGVRAKITSLNDLRNQAGANPRTPGFNGRDEVEYSLDQVEIFGEKYFFPHVEPGRVIDSGCPVNYLIPSKGGQVVIDNATGAITLRNPNEIYGPHLENEVNEAIKQQIEFSKNWFISGVTTAAEDNGEPNTLNIDTEILLMTQRLISLAFTSTQHLAGTNDDDPERMFLVFDLVNGKLVKEGNELFRDDLVWSEAIKTMKASLLTNYQGDPNCDLFFAPKYKGFAASCIGVDWSRGGKHLSITGDISMSMIQEFLAPSVLSDIIQ